MSDTVTCIPPSHSWKAYQSTFADFVRDTECYSFSRPIAVTFTTGWPEIAGVGLMK